MSYCPRCGVKLPDDEDVRFCPNCGTPITRLKPREIKVWQIDRRRRIMVFLLVFIVCISATIAGVISHVDPKQAHEIVKEINKLGEVTSSTRMGIPLIFGNNLMHTLIMFVPIVGPFWGLFVLYNTGTAYAAYAILYKASPLVLFSSAFILPFTWMEFISYALAISESLWITYALLKRNIKRELVLAAIMIAVCNILLLFGALIEAAIISSFPS